MMTEVLWFLHDVGKLGSGQLNWGMGRNTRGAHLDTRMDSHQNKKKPRNSTDCNFFSSRTTSKATQYRSLFIKTPCPKTINKTKKWTMTKKTLHKSKKNRTNIQKITMLLYCPMAIMVSDAKCRIANENPTAACLGELRNKFMETESSITAIPGFQMPANQTKTCGERKLYCAKDTGALELN